MRRFAIVLLGLTSLVSARSAFVSVPLTYVTPLTPGMQIGANGALNNPEVTRARHVNERMNQANEAARTIGPQVQTLRGRKSSVLVNDDLPLILAPTAPLGADGRVVDTPEVAAAKEAHAAAHVNEKINLANEAARSETIRDDSAIATPEATIGLDGRVLDTSEIATARAARVNEINLANEDANSGDAFARVVDGAVVPFVLDNNVVVALVPVGPDGRLLDAPEVAARGGPNLTNNAKTVDALAIAGPALAYGRFVY